MARSPQSLVALKGQRKIVSLTAYSWSTARLLDPFCDLILVGDSVGMVQHGMPNTVGVDLDMMILHGKSVAPACQNSVCIVDMPFGTAERGSAAAYDTAVRIVQETGCKGVKFECFDGAAQTVEFLVKRGIPVMGHLGLLPQHVHAKGYRYAGTSEEEVASLISQALDLESAGVFSMVIEGTLAPVANQLTQSVSVPTIGIGASVDCDGQILVSDDLLGLSPKVPSFAKIYTDLSEQIRQAAESYAKDVQEQKFPAADHQRSS